MDQYDRRNVSFTCSIWQMHHAFVIWSIILIRYYADNSRVPLSFQHQLIEKKVANDAKLVYKRKRNLTLFGNLAVMLEIFGCYLSVQAQLAAFFLA